jgi:Domain of unknown function (DUF4349)
MTMIDEGTLSAALHATADEFAVSDSAAQRIVDQMRAETTVPVTGIARLVRQPSRARVVVMGAAALVIALTVGIPLAAHETHRPITVVHGAQASIKRVLTPSAAQSGALTVTASGAAAPATTLTGTSFKGGTISTIKGSEKIESTGTVGVSVADGHIRSALSKLSSLVAGDHGFVNSSQASTGSRTRGTFTSGTIVLEVPQASFNRLVAQVEKVGRTTSVVTNSDDVTSQYVNLQARISALKVSLNQYLAIMTRATSISGILAVQSQIDQIQSQIEQDQGQLNVLNHETTYASLTVNVATPAHHAASTRRSGIDKAWHDSVGGFVSGFEWLIRLAGPVLFVLLALAALSALAMLSWRTIRRRRI